jgi:orotidine-5'-phosphate decarboxylase
MKMDYVDLLKESAQKNGSIVCIGLDPVLERIPLKEGSVEDRIFNFYSEILVACVSEGVLPGAVKPNYAFYAQYGFEGLRALKKVIELAKGKKIPVIFDGKRGDIGKTSAAYAREAFEFWQADCLTVAPYMGEDSVSPFIKFCEEKGKGIYVLNRTSNPGAADFQSLEFDGLPLYLNVSGKVLEWGEKAKGNVGVVVGATSPTELKEISEFFASAGQKVPFLIPGVGAQGGSGREVAAILKKAGLDLSVQRISSSSGINYAFEKQETDDFAGAAVKALKKLNDEIGKF